MPYLRMHRWWTAGTPWTLWTLCCLVRAKDPSDAAAVMYTTSFRLGSGAPLVSDLGGAPLPEAPLQHGGHLPYTIVTNPLGTLRPCALRATVRGTFLMPLLYRQHRQVPDRGHDSTA